MTDLALHYLAKAKILVIRDIEREEIEFISKTLHCQPVAHPDHDARQARSCRRAVVSEKQSRRTVRFSSVWNREHGSNGLRHRAR